MFPPASPFELWFAECVLIALDGARAPEDYVWDLADCQGWTELFDIGLTPQDAVARTFHLQ